MLEANKEKPVSLSRAESGLVSGLKDAAAISAGAAVGYGLGVGASELSLLWGRVVTQNSSPLSPEVTNFVRESIRLSWSVSGIIGGYLVREYSREIRSAVREFFRRD